MTASHLAGTRNIDDGVYIVLVGQVAKTSMFQLAEVEWKLGSRASTKHLKQLKPEYVDTMVCKRIYHREGLVGIPYHVSLSGQSLQRQSLNVSSVLSQ